MSSDFTLYIQTNSPGELSSWVTSIVKEAVSLDPYVDIVIFLTPCEFSSGQEKELAMALPNVSRVYAPRETLGFIFGLPFRKKHKGQGALLFLGGDPLYTRLLGFRLGVPKYAYTEHENLRLPGFKRVFYKDSDGDLMGVKVAHFLEEHPPVSWGDRHYCLFFPGSRPQHFLGLFPIMIETIQEIRKNHPDFKARVAISPFITQKQFTEAFEACDSAGIEVVVQSGLEQVQHARLLITIPGTNTAEAMYLQTPMQVVIPLNNPKALILSGTVGLLTRIPIIGYLIRLLVLDILKNQTKFYALPNLMLEKEVVPELIAILYPKQWARSIERLYYDNDVLENMVEELGEMPINEDIAREICLDILD